MSSAFEEALSLCEQLRMIFDQPQPSLEKCKDIITKLKLVMTKFNPVEYKKQLVLSREILEYGALLSIKTQDIPAFERYITQLKPYYYDYSSNLSDVPSQRQWTLLGLNLLRLLAKNKMDEFHTELELIPLEKHQNIYIKHNVQLEQYMMEGAYNKVLKAKEDVPSETYIYFMDILMETVRDEIADCAEKAYHTISLGDAQKLLGFSNTSDLISYANKRNWNILQGKINFKKEQEAKTDIPSLKIIGQTLSYARELERIV